MTISDAFTVPTAAAAPDGSSAAAPDRPRVHARMRARGYRSLSVVRKAAGLGAVAAADLRSAWWTPASLPTLSQAWADRTPDRERVPGDNAAVYWAWVVYAHTIGLVVPAVALAVVGVLTPLVWTARHPARFLLLAVLVGVPLAVLIAR